MRLRDEVDERLADAQREAHAGSAWRAAARPRAGLRPLPQNCASLKTTRERVASEHA
jgi:hypothetical protein